MNSFARKDLLVAICFLVFLGMLASSWLGRSGRNARRVACGENGRRLLIGFHGYANDHGTLPASGRVIPPRISDWIYWQQNRRLADSALATNVNGFSESLRCPGDTEFRRRAYRYSYTMNVHIEQQDPREMSNTNHLILLFEEAAPNDGGCAAGEPRDKLTRRHTGRSNAGFLDGRVEVIKEREAVRSEHVRPVFKPPPTPNIPLEGPPIL